MSDPLFSVDIYKYRWDIPQKELDCPEQCPSRHQKLENQPIMIHASDQNGNCVGIAAITHLCSQLCIARSWYRVLRSSCLIWKRSSRGVVRHWIVWLLYSRVREFSPMWKKATCEKFARKRHVSVTCHMMIDRSSVTCRISPPTLNRA